MIKRIMCWIGFHLGRIYTQVIEFDENVTYEETKCLHCNKTVDKVYFDTHEAKNVND